MVGLLNQIIKAKNKRDKTDVKLIENYRDLQLYLAKNKDTLKQDISLLGFSSILNKLTMAHKLENFEEKNRAYVAEIASIDAYRLEKLAELEKEGKVIQMCTDPLNYLKTHITPMLLNINIPGRVKPADIEAKITEFETALGQLSPNSVTEEVIKGLETFCSENEYSLMLQFDESSPEFQARTRLNNILKATIHRLKNDAAPADNDKVLTTQFSQQKAASKQCSLKQISHKALSNSFKMSLIKV